MSRRVPSSVFPLSRADLQAAGRIPAALAALTLGALLGLPIPTVLDGPGGRATVAAPNGADPPGPGDPAGGSILGLFGPPAEPVPGAVLPAPIRRRMPRDAERNGGPRPGHRGRVERPPRPVS